MEYIVRQARTRDVPEIRELIDQNVGSRRLLEKHTVNLYEDILEFTVAEASTDGAVAGCGSALRFVCRWNRYDRAKTADICDAHDGCCQK